MGKKLEWGTNKKLNAIHVGGGGNFGPIEKLFPVRKDLHLTIMEANIESIAWRQYESRAINQTKNLGINLKILPACISDRVGKAVFHIATDAKASSLYPMAPSARTMKRPSGSGRGLTIWDHVCRTTKEVVLPTTTIDQLVAEKKVPPPNVLSMDIQGSDYDALVGSRILLQGETLSCVICESEFRELYDGQKLFHDLHGLLLKAGFFLGDLPYQKRWHTGFVYKRGFLTVIETIYLKDFHTMSSFQELIKLALIANQYNFVSYMYEIIQHVVAKHPEKWQVFRADRRIRFNGIIAGAGQMLEEHCKVTPTKRIFR